MPTVSRSVPPPPGSSPLYLRGVSSEDLRRRLITLTVARLLVAMIFLLVGSWALSRGAANEQTAGRALRGVVISIFVASVGYALMLARGQNLRLLAVVQIGLDVAVWTAIVYVTGGPTSPMSFFFALSALTAALVLGADAARITALTAIGIYTSLAILMAVEILPPLGDSLHRPLLSRAELAFQIVVNALAVILVAALGSGLAARLSQAGGALARLEASRAALAALYEDVLRSIPVALLTCAPDGTIEGANPGAAELFTVPIEGLLGTPVSRWLPFIPEDAFAPDRGLRVGDETLDILPSRPRIAYRAAPLFNRGGRARGGLVVIEDRSGVEAMREAVQHAERLAALGRLAAGLAHEVRNPLGAILGGVELVCEGSSLSAEDRELLATVRREVARLNDLVTDMLSFARPRPPDLTPTDLIALAREVAVLASARDQRVPVVLTEPQSGEAFALVDPAQVRQVFWNLVRNASQASPDGARVEVSVRTHNDRVELAVADRGRGIPPEIRNRIFDVFYSERSHGTGLGLAIVRQIANAHGASVEVRGRDGGGTEFAVLFPAVVPRNLLSASSVGA